jgi:endonuclease/exonuclease/phosphatase family metal-dependent hydrolase
VAVNVAQIEGVSRARLGVLADSLAKRPIPDVVVTEEMAAGHHRAFRDMLNERFEGAEFEITGPQAREFRAKVMVDASRNEVAGVSTWVSPCASDYLFPIVQLEKEGDPYSVTGMHVKYDANEACKIADIQKLRRETADIEGVAIAAGDFNRRPVEQEKECDPQERSGALEWWELMTDERSVDGNSWVDAVREVVGSSEAMADQWTREAEEPVELCDGSKHYRRVRIDYVFVRSAPGMRVIDATVDHPGWAGDEPGTTSCEPSDACKYSDHRFVWARVQL